MTTEARLLDAAETVIANIGYARTTEDAVCAEAGVERAALDQHFPSKLALLVSTAERVAARLTAEFAEEFGGVDLSRYTVHAALLGLRRLVRSHSNQVWHELMHASRTDAELRDALQPALRDYHRRTAMAAISFAGDYWSDEFVTALRIIINYLDGEASVAHVLPDQERDDETLLQLAAIIRPLMQARETRFDPS